MAMSHCSDEGGKIAVVDVRGVDVADVFASNLATLFDTFFRAVSRYEAVHYGITDLQCFMGFPPVARELSGSICQVSVFHNQSSTISLLTPDDPEVYMELSSI